ncbi:MAG TPA: c-type cytochrome [Gammaproteobacteria bacterium]|nr:c-type cytochrome [Gammaproteobacteria bacterium]
MLMIAAAAFGPACAGTPETNEYTEALGLRPDANRGAELFERCAACHQSSGHGVPDGSVPAIAGQHFEVVIGQLADMRDDERHNSRMEPFTGDAELPGAQALADVSAHISRLPPNPEPQPGPGAELELGKDLYHGLCSHCHGIGGEGDSELQIPRVQGQHYAYLIRQIEALGTGARHTLDPGTSDLLRDLSRREIEAVADYMSRLIPLRMPSRPPARAARPQDSAASGR